MKRTNILLVMVGSILLIGCGPKQQENTIPFVEDLLSQMTLEEKVGQLVQYTGRGEVTGPVFDAADAEAQELNDEIKAGHVGSMLNVTGVEATRKAQELAVENSRLGIPLVIGYDVIHGYVTMFPIPLAEAASFNPDIAYQSARIAAVETAASGIHWTFAPMVDIYRDARWGRVMEGAGEDPYLGAKFAEARVKGFQGDDLKANNTIAACAKHFAGYGFIEAGREYNSAEITENTLRNIVLPPFKACVDAGVATFMNGFNELNGMPVTGSKYLLDDILRKEWNYDGMVVSDWGSIKELVVHGVARDSSEAAQLAIIAGSDMDMEGYCYPVHLVELVRSGKVDEDYVDRAARRVLSFKYKLGLFDDPYKYCDEEREKVQVYNVEHRAKARELAREAMVLLKNEQAILPLDKSSLQTIAVIGELAADRNSPLGSWRAQAIPNSAVSLLDGIKTAKSNKGVAYAKGPDYILNEPSFVTELEINTTSTEGMAEAVRLAKKSDVVVLCLGEHCFQSGEARSQTDIKLKGKQLDLLDAIVQVNKNVVLVLMNGRPLDLTDVVGKVPAILETWHLGSESGNAIADVLFGDYNPSGKLPMTFPRNVGQCPIYYNHKNTGRPTDVGDGVFWSHYTDSENSPLFPFGYGLSYTSFDYSNFSISNEKLQRGKALTVSVEISNVGRYAGAEVVQLYIRDHFASVAPAVCQLKGFEKIYLEVGESVTVTFELEEKDLAFYNPYKQEWGAESGDFSVWIGIDPSDDLVAQFELL